MINKELDHDHLALYKQYFLPIYDPVDFIPIKAHGSILYDINNHEVVDFAGGVAACALGQTSKILNEALYKQMQNLWHVGNIFTNIPQIKLAKKLIDNTCFDKIFFCNSGSEAVEAALKIARRYAVKRYHADKHQIVAFNHAFHGRTLLAVSAGGQEKYWEGFSPLPGGITHGIFNDIDGLELLINDNTAAVIVEPIQAEGGVIVANHEFLLAIRKLCDRHNAAMIFDEVQTGLGRTGSLFAYIDYNIIPDMITIAKALGNGMPIGALLVSKPFDSGFEFGSHGATFGGNPLSCAAANCVFDIINNQEFLNNVQYLHELFIKQLTLMNDELQIYCDIRGKGLLLGMELRPEYHGLANKLIHIAIKHGVSILSASINVTRLLPALNIDENIILEGIKRLRSAIIEFKNIYSLSIKDTLR